MFYCPRWGTFQQFPDPSWDSLRNFSAHFRVYSLATSTPTRVIFQNLQPLLEKLSIILFFFFLFHLDNSELFTSYWTQHYYSMQCNATYFCYNIVIIIIIINIVIIISLLLFFFNNFHCSYCYCQNKTGQPFSSPAFSGHLKFLFKRLTGVEISVNVLRSSFLTHAYSLR
jgi:hypothetical protein